MLTLSAFLALQPEFTGAPVDLLQGTLDQAALRLSPTVLGTLVDEAHRWLTADMLAHSPWGRAANLSAAEKESVYRPKYEELVQIRGGMLGLL